MPDFPGFIVGVACIAALWFMYRHADALSDGNVGGEK